MKIHEMKLLKEPFTEIEAGRKSIEMRLYDEKRKGIAEGDKILFVCPELSGRSISALVRGVYIYEDFFSLAESYVSRELGFDGASAEYIGRYMMGIYSEEMVKNYGVCAILLEIQK